MKKRFLVALTCATMILPSMAAMASGMNSRNGEKDCKASIQLTKSSGTFTLYEGGPPMNPITQKKIEGKYISESTYGVESVQTVYSEKKTGQISVTKKVPDSTYTSIKGWMDYYLNGTYKGRITEHYSMN